jgi:glycosyltransferase involved in cell wall biosynthesis
MKMETQAMTTTHAVSTSVIASAMEKRHTEPPQLAIVVPCYNEEEVLPETSKRLGLLLDDLIERGLADAGSAVYFVDDGSRDRTWELVAALAASDRRMHGIKLSRNRGHQNALLAGLFNAPGDVLVSVDADLQDDLGVIAEMLTRYREGAEVVYGVRRARTTDTAFKRGSAEAYYRLLKTMGVDIVFNHADYRLMTRRVIDCLSQYTEVNLFLRGIVPQIGFRSATVYYERAERYAGESKYPLKKMLAFAMDGITSFSVVPLRFLAALGLLFCGMSFLMVVWVVYGTLVLHNTVPGWASSVIPIYFLGGVQLLGLGILGEYVAKIYLETKRRPRFIVETTV